MGMPLASVENTLPTRADVRDKLRTQFPKSIAEGRRFQSERGHLNEGQQVQLANFELALGLHDAVRKNLSAEADLKAGWDIKQHALFELYEELVKRARR